MLEFLTSFCLLALQHMQKSFSICILFECFMFYDTPEDSRGHTDCKAGWEADRTEKRGKAECEEESPGHGADQEAFQRF